MFGLRRRHQSEMLMDARRILLKVRNRWYPIMLQLHGFMIPVARVTVNHDGRGRAAPDPVVWDQGGPKKARRLGVRINVDLCSSPGRPGFLNGPWMQVHGGCTAGADIVAWPYSVGILFKFTAFLGTLHWPVDTVDMGHFGVSYLEVLILYEQWAGHRLLSVKVTWPHLRADRLVYFSSVPVSEGVEIGHGCQYISFLVRALAKLPGGVGWILMVSLPGHWNLVIVNASRLSMGFWDIQMVQLWSFWMAL